jgi:plastocyanin
MAGDAVGSDAGIPVDVSVTTVAAPLADIVASEHSIVVHESAENIGNYVLCGDIGGTMLGASDLPVGLRELNESGASGVAWLHDNGDGTTEVRLTVTMDEEDHEMGDHDMGTPDADAGATEVQVSIENFSYGDPIEVAVGTTVTWTNADSAPHTVTQVGGQGFQSNKIDPGATFSFTFTEAGTFDYFCEYHANMKGTVVVK